MVRHKSLRSFCYSSIVPSSSSYPCVASPTYISSSSSSSLGSSQSSGLSSPLLLSSWSSFVCLSLSSSPGHFSPVVTVDPFSQSVIQSILSVSHFPFSSQT